MRNMSLLQKLAIAYAIMFYFIASLAYIPGLADEHGNLFGLFHLELHDDILHLLSGVWATVAAWRSRFSSLRFFQIFGVLYGMDGVLGLLTGQGYLDAGIFFNGIGGVDLMTRIGANLPHILIGGIAVYIGYFLSRSSSAGVA